MRARNNVTVVGDGAPTLLLAHGFGCDQNMWRPLVERLRNDFRLVLFDLVGFGKSDPASWDIEKYSSLEGFAADVLDIVNGLDLRDVVFVGHSVSAMIGVLAAIADPSRFAKLVLITPSPCYLNDGDYHGGFSRPDIDELLESLDSNYLGWSEAMAPTIMGADRPDLQREWTDSFCRSDPGRLRTFARATFLSDNRSDLHRLTVPCLIIDSSQDAIAPREVGEYVKGHIADGRLITLDTIGHSPHLSAPDASAEAVAAFARST